MSDDVLEQLRRENPVPNRMPALPLEPVLARLDDESSTAAARSGIRPWGPRRLIRALPIALSVAVVLAVVGVVVTVGDHHRSAHPPASHRGGSTAPSKGSARASHRTSGSAATSAGRYLIAYLFPASGADWASGGRLTTFALKVRIKAETQCMAADGLPGPSVDYGQPQAQFGTEDLPNMPVIKRTMNVGVTTMQAPTNPAKSLSPAKRKAYEAAIPRCAASAQSTDPLGGEQASKLASQWLDMSATVFAAPAVRAANRRAAACSRQTAFPAQTVGGEIETIETKLTPLNLKGHNAQARAVNANGVRVLIKCFGAVVTLRDRLLAAQRTRFLAQHAHAIQQLKNQANRLVTADEAKYGIKLGAVTATGPTPIGTEAS